MRNKSVKESFLPEQKKSPFVPWCAELFMPPLLISKVCGFLCGKYTRPISETYTHIAYLAPPAINWIEKNRMDTH